MKKIIPITIIIITFTSLEIYAQSTFKSETLCNAITNYVKNTNKCESEVEINQVIKDHKFSQSGVKASITHNADLTGLCKVELSFLLNGEVINKEEIRIKVKLFAKVPIALRFIRKTETLTASDIAIKRTEVTTIDPNAVVELNDAIGNFATKNIAKGAIVQWTDISLSNNTDESNVSIKKNDKVKLLKYSGGICIKTDGYALESGGPGSVIKVKKDNAQTLYGFVAEDGNVILEDKQTLLK